MTATPVTESARRRRAATLIPAFPPPTTAALRPATETSGLEAERPGRDREQDGHPGGEDRELAARRRDRGAGDGDLPHRVDERRERQVRDDLPEPPGERVGREERPGQEHHREGGGVRDRRGRVRVRRPPGDGNAENEEDEVPERREEEEPDDVAVEVRPEAVDADDEDERRLRRGEEKPGEDLRDG